MTVRRPYAFHPTLENLEDRTVPSTLLVTTGADSGIGSLRQAILNAASGDTVAVVGAVHAITLTTGELDVTKSLSVVGAGAGLLTVSGNNASRIFHVEAGATLRLSGMTLTGGFADTSDGGNAPGGGAIRNEAGATLFLTGMTLTGNQAVGTVGLDEFGGALFNQGRATVNTCVFSNNQVTGAGSFTAIGGSAGGAIDNFAGGVLNVFNSRFTGNRVVSADGPSFFALGGAIDSNAGLDGFNPAGAVGSTATITNCVFNGNAALGGAQGGMANAGAFFNEGLGCVMTVTGSTISGNRAVGGDGGANNSSEGIGGGIMNGLGTMTIIGCSILNNQAVGGANAVNTAASPLAGGAFGGGIENNFNGTLIIRSSIIAGNVARGGAAAAGPGGSAFGGGISNSPSATLTMTGCVVTGNRAIGGASGPGGNAFPAGLGFGGGIDTSAASTTTLNGCTISGNVAQGGASGAGTNGGDGLGGGLAVGQNAVFGTAMENSHLTVNHCFVVGNQAIGGAGGAGANGGDGKGGGVFLFSPVGSPGETSATLIGSTVAANTATGGLAGAGGLAGQGIGGGVYNERGTFAALMSLIFANRATPSNNDVFSV